MPFLSGLLLGLAMILPIGPQNLFVLSQGMRTGFRWGMAAAITTGVCDTLLIVAGASGLSVALSHLPHWVQSLFLLIGVGFLLYLGIGLLREKGESGLETAKQAGAPRLLSVLLTGVAVSWGNPHAVLDTVAVLGSAIAGWQPESRLLFAAGTVSASWLFFFTLAAVGAVFGARLPLAAQGWVRKGSGAVMLLFAVVLGWHAFTAW